MTDAPDRIPPSDLVAEQATLGAMMTSRKACVVALSIVTRDDFYREAHRDIFDAICTLREAGEIVDALTVESVLKRREKLDTTGGASSYLQRILREVVTLAHTERYATIVHDLGRLRRIIAACNDIMRDAYEHEGKPEELLRGHLGKLQAIAGDCTDDRTALHVSSTLEELKERVKRQRTRGEKISAARFGIPQIDRALNGLEDWGMIVVRGDAKVGKSLLSGSAALSTACELVRIGDSRVVLAYILEAREEWEERAIAWLGHIDKRALEGRKPMREGDEDRYQYALEQWANLPLYVTDRLTHVDEIMLDVEQQVMQNHQPALILVDHFQRVIGDGETATLRYDNAAQKLCQLPRIHKCPLLVPSQISVNNGVRQSMWARRLDQEATVVFDITGERDNPERILHPTLPRKYVPFGEGKYYVGTNYDGRLWDERTWIGMGENKQ